MHQASAQRAAAEDRGATLRAACVEGRRLAPVARQPDRDIEHCVGQPGSQVDGRRGHPHGRDSVRGWL